MAYFLFIDESGQDHKSSPYEVLAGIAIEWGFRRINGMVEPARTELSSIVNRVCRLRHRTLRQLGENERSKLGALS